jgi:hypothetical protein
MRRFGLCALLVICASCVADIEAAGDGAGGGDGVPAPEDPFVVQSVTAIAEHLGFASEALTECQKGCLAFAREGCQHAMEECRGHEDDNDETACASDGAGGEYVVGCPTALALACNGLITQHQCYMQCQQEGRP